ncbi:MAG: RhuM family protein, partial [Bacteroidota bacterium]
FYQKVKEIYTTSIDYDGQSHLSQVFYATIQNKLHWAIHQNTAAELIQKRVDASKQNMGLTTWKGWK